MAEAYPIDLRQPVVAAYLSGEGSFVQIAKLFELGTAMVVGGSISTGRTDTSLCRRRAVGRHLTWDPAELQTIVAKLGDGTANEITAEYKRHRRGPNRRHASSIKRALHRAGYVVKRNAYGRLNSYGLPS